MEITQANIRIDCALRAAVKIGALSSDEYDYACGIITAGEQRSVAAHPDRSGDGGEKRACMCSGLGPCEGRTDGSCRRAAPVPQDGEDERAAWFQQFLDETADAERPYARRALISCIAECQALSYSEDRGITITEAESIGGVLLELRRLQKLEADAVDVLTRAESPDAALASNKAAAVAVGEPTGNYGLSPLQLDSLLRAGLKPEEIGGTPAAQHDRVRELLHWFARFLDGHANPKWARAHAYELAYFVATNGMNRTIDIRAIADAAYKEGVNIKPDERRLLERLGIATPPAPIASASEAVPAAYTWEYFVENEDCKPHWRADFGTPWWPNWESGAAPDITKVRSLKPLYTHPAAAQPSRAEEACKLCNSTGHSTPCAYPTEINRQQAKRIAELVPQVETLALENQRFRVDAERYRWLRDEANRSYVEFGVYGSAVVSAPSADHLDEEVDAARSQSDKEKP